MSRNYSHADWPVSKEGEELFIYNKETEETSVLNSTAVLIYNLCTFKSAEEIAKTIFLNLNYENNITQEEILEDVKEILSNFLKKGLIMQV